MKKILVLFLVCLMLLPVLAACSDKPSNPGNQTGGNSDSNENPKTEIETDEWGRPIQKTDFDPSGLNFGGDKLTVLCAGTDETSYWAMDPGIYKKPNDALEMALYKRNMQIEQDLGLSLKVAFKDGAGSASALNQAVEKDAKSGLNEYDIVVNYSAYAVAENLRGYYVDLLAADTPYLQLDRPWYNQNFVENTQAFGHLYYIVGDYNLCTYNRLMATYFNRSLCYAQGIISDDSGDDLYDMVQAGKWTYSQLYEYAKIYNDDGDGIPNQSDIYGLLSNANCEAYDGFLYAFNLDLTVTNEDGTHSWNVAGNTKMTDAMDKLISLYRQEGVWLIAKSQGSAGNSTEQYKMFAEGHALFDIDVIYRYAEQNKAFRNMKDKYGLLPLPKYDEEQEKYGSGTQDSHSFTSIMKGSAELNAKRCAYLEYANYLSYQNSRPYYFEKIMKAQYLGTAKSAQIFDIILDNADFDFGEQYSIALDGAKHKLWRFVAKNEGTVSGAWTTNEKTLNKKLQELDAWFLAQ